MKKILAVLMAMIMTCLTGAALASAGDRTLLTTNQGGGYTSEYVENAILSGGKIYLNTMAASNGFYIFDLATGESTRYSMEKMEERMRGINGNEEQKNEYYPYGGPWGDASTNQGFQPYKYNGKELDLVHGLD